MTTITWVRLGVIALVALVVQIAILDGITILGAHPDVMIVLAATAGLTLGPQRGAIVGFTVGLFADLVVDTPFGLSALTFVLVAFGVGLLRSIPSSRDTKSAQILVVIAASGVGTFLYGLLGAIVGKPGMLGEGCAIAVLVVALGSLLLSVPALWVLPWAFRDSRSPLTGTSIPSGGSAMG